MLGKWFDKPVMALEIQKNLCQQGKNLAIRAGVKISFCEIDLRKTKPLLPTHQCVVGLHACGDLTDNAIEAAINNQSAIIVSPCCYHAIDSTEYIPKSTLGQQWNLHLDKKQLKLPSAFEVVATDKQKTTRRKEVCFRLGFDWLLQNAGKTQKYTSFPPIPPAWVAASFADFCRLMLQRHNIKITRFDADMALQKGEQKAQVFRRLSMIRTPFRRLIELWLVLDKALWLQEAGWECKLGTFCSEDLTPRNILLLAEPANSHNISIISN